MDELFSQLISLNRLIKRKVQLEIGDKGNKFNPDRVTELNVKVVDLLKKEKEVYQKDVENYLGVSRATVSALVKSMEKKGMITRESVENDQRLKKIVLNKQFLEEHQKLTFKINEIEHNIKSVLSEKELQDFLNVVDKMKKYLEE